MHRTLLAISARRECSGRLLPHLVIRRDVDGAAAARIAWIGGHVEADALPDLEHLEPTIGNRRVVEKELFALSVVGVRRDEPKPAIP